VRFVPTLYVMILGMSNFLGGGKKNKAKGQEPEEGAAAPAE